MPRFEETVGVVGAGAMGFPIMRHLIGAGFEIVCRDLNDDTLQAAERLGARAGRSGDDLAGCGVLLVFVPTDDDVRAVAGEFAKVGREGAYFVIHSSVRTATARQVGADLSERGIRTVDAALTGGVRGAEIGEINLLVGGAAEDVAALEAVFAPWTSHVHHLGDLGKGQVGKTVNNLIHWGQIVSIVEALSLGQELGVQPELIRAALVTGPTDSRTLREIQEMRFTWYEKDIDNAKEMATAIGRELPFSPIVQEFMRSIDVAKVHNLLAGAGPVELTRR